MISIQIPTERNLTYSAITCPKHGFDVTQMNRNIKQNWNLVFLVWR